VAHLAALLAVLLARQTISGVDTLSVGGLLRGGDLQLLDGFAAVSLVAVLISANSSLAAGLLASVSGSWFEFLVNVAALMLDQLYGCVACLCSTIPGHGSLGLHLSVAGSDRAGGNRHDRHARRRPVLLQAATSSIELDRPASDARRPNASGRVSNIFRTILRCAPLPHISMGTEGLGSGLCDSVDVGRRNGKPPPPRRLATKSRSLEAEHIVARSGIRSVFGR